MKLFAFVFGVLLSLNCYSQNKVSLKNGKQYDATDVWEFISNSYVYDGSPKVQIIKTEIGGLLKISVKVSSEKLYVGDRIFINLKNNTLIYSLDKGNREYKDGVASTYFTLNSKDIQLLKNQEIADVRFKILGNRRSFDSQIGFFTTSNILTVFDAFTPEKTTIDTKSAIKNLYNKK